MGSSNRGQPIVIADYDPAWVAKFEAARDSMFAACGREAFVAIEHIGSTSVPGLAAKPIIDMMPGLRSLDDAPPIIARLVALGYQYVPEFEQDTASGPGMPHRRYLRGNDGDGRRAYHVHMVEHGGDFWTAHLLFRDYLRRHPEAAEAYAQLKRELATGFNATITSTSDINVGYTDRKTEFVEDIVARARAERAPR
ncbi:GrpB family protein [Nannocystis sp. RBIL2]|uniref:GrpB family protein n=1 Tax=Nannocystis sp. RBIL2 TaxID=2996788 RepID=UPI002271EC92|nr:GrpB family protein [Nannocystis sp. RBIL2]MCY1065195.1 GrpB family protein [Nannocystis sp. RBIL2]